MAYPAVDRIDLVQDHPAVPMIAAAAMPAFSLPVVTNASHLLR